MTDMAETCAYCGVEKPIVLSLVNPDGSEKPLCQDCAAEWLDSEEDWPPENLASQT